MSENKKNKMSDIEKQKILRETGVIGFKDRLSLALEGLSGNAFAKKVSMSEAVIRDYLSGRTYPSLNRLAIIAEKCDLSIEWLSTGKGECRLTPNRESQKIVHIPVYKPSNLVDQSKDIYNINNLNITHIPFDLKWLKYRDHNIDELFIYWVKGDAMNPTISDNDAIVINTKNNIAYDGYIYLIQYGDSLSIKRVQNQGKLLLLLSDNEKYPSIEIDKLNINEDFKIIGRVIYILKDLS